MERYCVNMYLHIGKDIVINQKDIVFILNFNSIEENKENEKLLKEIKKKENIIDISNGIQKTIILVKNKELSNWYVTNISTSTLYKRKF